MAAVASNNWAASATFLLVLIITSSWCMASAVPAANGRRLDNNNMAAGGRLAGQLEALNSGLEKLSIEVHALLDTAAVPDDLKAQLQPVAATCDVARLELQAALQGLVNLTATLAQPQVLGALEGMLHQLAAKLGTFEKHLQSPPPAGACFDTLKENLMGGVSELISQLGPIATGLLPGDETLITALQNMRDAVNQVDPCAPGLENLRGNGQGVIDVVGELVVSIQ